MDLDSALKDKPAEGAAATAILRADHDEVRQLVQDYESAGASAAQRKIALRSLCFALELHDHIEREVFYPAAREADATLVDTFIDAHDDVMRIVRSLRDRESCDSECDAAVSQLTELVDRHIRQEEDELFPRIEQQGDAKLREIGAAIVARKEHLTRSTGDFEGPAT